MKGFERSNHRRVKDKNTLHTCTIESFVHCVYTCSVSMTLVYGFLHSHKKVNFFKLFYKNLPVILILQPSAIVSYTVCSAMNNQSQSFWVLDRSLALSAHGGFFQAIKLAFSLKVSSCHFARTSQSISVLLHENGLKMLYFIRTFLVTGCLVHVGYQGVSFYPKVSFVPFNASRVRYFS